MISRKYLNPTVLLSVRKNIYGGRTMSECSIVSWLFDIVVESFGSYETIRYFGCLEFVNSFVQV